MAPRADHGDERMSKTGKKSEPSKLSDLAVAPYNPRRISPAASAGLRASLSTFGDIAGIVWNTRTGHLVCGHQRVAELTRLHGDLSIADGRATAPDGESWAVRVVDWPLAREKAANVAANNPHVAGEFTEDVAALLAEIQAADEKLFVALALDKLGADYPLPPDEGLTGARASLDYEGKLQVLIECKSEKDQANIYEEMKRRGYECKLLML